VSNFTTNGRDSKKANGMLLFKMLLRCRWLYIFVILVERLRCYFLTWQPMSFFACLMLLLLISIVPVPQFVAFCRYW